MYSVITYKNKQQDFFETIVNAKIIMKLLTPKILLYVLLFDISQIPSLMTHLIGKYIFGDFSFLPWLVILMVVDFITGVTKSWVKKEAVTSKGFRDTVSKFIQYGALLIITHAVTHFEVDGQAVGKGLDWLVKLAYEFLIFIEVKSIYENVTEINPRLDFIKVITLKAENYLKIWNQKFRTPTTTETTTIKP